MCNFFTVKTSANNVKRNKRKFSLRVKSRYDKENFSRQIFCFWQKINPLTANILLIAKDLREYTFMDLFDFNGNEEGAKPLAERMRANNLNEFIGQQHIVAEGSLLRRAISLDRLGSCIFWGPPGTGKTTLANIIASTTHGEFIKLNAVQAGVADVKRAVEQARDNLKMYGRRTYLMLDECHRFNKTQSDSLLPAIEQGTVIFIGSTTENPYSSMTPARRA